MWMDLPCRLFANPPMISSVCFGNGNSSNTQHDWPLTANAKPAETSKLIMPSTFMFCNLLNMCDGGRVELPEGVDSFANYADVPCQVSAHRVTS